MNLLKNPLANQRGALFGLDARLGLLVFGALSVVAGFYAFNRVTTAREAALIRDITAVEQALKTYQADMNTFYLFTIDKSADFSEDASQDLTALWDKSRVKQGFQHLWNGPYLHNETLSHRTYGTYGLSYGQAERDQFCSLDSACYVWLSLTEVPAKIWTKINTYLDESGGKTQESNPHLNGIIQSDSALTEKRTLFFRTIERTS